jgi:hypothetical protein
MSSVSEAYDPQAPEDEGPRRSAYLSRKDLKVLAIAIAVLLLLLLPIYHLLKKRSEKSLCSRNMAQIATALGLYAAEHDERFPPAYTTALGSQAPGPAENSQWPGTWGGDVIGSMQRGSLVCPSAQPDEIVQTAHPESSKRALPMTYGMYAPYGAYPRSSVENPDQVVLIAETSNLGSQGTFDPLPFSGGDAFVIGWNNNNFDPDDSTRFVTRLAFPNSQGGVFDEEGPARHSENIHALSASGQLLRLKPNHAQVVIVRSLGLPGGTWAVPARAKRR